MTAPIHLEDLRCDGCGSAAVIAFAPGNARTTDLLLLPGADREVPLRCRCMACLVVVKEVA